MLPKCVCCEADAVTLVGPIPPAICFAGRTLSTPLVGGDLFRCGSCGLAFRYPSLDKAELDALYRRGKAENWQAPQKTRVDWKIANQWLSRYLKPDGAILDVGCYDGGFLRSIGSGYRRYGIEMHEAAQKKAQNRGIHILGADFATLSEAKEDFDVVVAFDVIEHTHNPFAFLSDLAKVTRENGMIIISTGNTDALSWRIMGSSYWYCSVAEHLSFVNPRWCEWAARGVDLELVQVIKFSHASAAWWKRMDEMIKNILYVASPRGFAWLRAAGLGGSEYRAHDELLSYPPHWMSAKDHFIMLFRRN